MEVYIETVYIINSILLLFSFEMLFFLLNCRTDLMKLFQYIFTFNISLVLLYIDLFHGFILFYDLVLFLIYFKNKTYIYYPLFIFIYISVLTFISKLIDSSYIYQGILLIQSDYSFILVIFLLFISIFIYLYMYYCRHKIHDYKVKVYLNKYTLTGLNDTGNTVFYRGYPVILINKYYLSDYDIIDRINVRTAISYQILDIVVIESIKINDIELNNVYAALMDEGEYDCILNYHLLGGML